MAMQENTGGSLKGLSCFRSPVWNRVGKLNYKDLAIKILKISELAGEAL